MTSRLKEALQRLEAAFARSGAPTMQYLRPGISVDQQEEILGPTGLQLSSELATLWSWRNGTYPTRDPANLRKSAFGPLFQFCGIRESITLSNDWRVGLDDPLREWPANFLIIGKCRDPYAAATGPEPESELWRWELDPDTDNHRRCTTSLAQAAETWTLALNENWWTWDRGESRWYIDYDPIPRDLNLSRVVG